MPLAHRSVCRVSAIQWCPQNTDEKFQATVGQPHGEAVYISPLVGFQHATVETLERFRRWRFLRDSLNIAVAAMSKIDTTVGPTSGDDPLRRAAFAQDAAPIHLAGNKSARLA